MSYGFDGLGGGFSDPNTGPNGDLLIPAIQSPNFVSGVQGWQINKSGDAQFNDLEVRGTFVGTEFIINDQGMFLYSGTPATGNLIGSWAVTAGTDGYNNTFPAGFNNVAADNSILMAIVGSIMEIQFKTGNTNVTQPSVLTVQGIGSGTNEYDQVYLQSATTDVVGDKVGVYINSGNGDVSSPLSPNVALLYTDGANGEHPFVEVDVAGATLNGATMVGVEPGTGTGAPNTAVPETWHDMALITPFVAATGASNYATPRYRVEPNGNGKVVTLSGAVTTPSATTAGMSVWQYPTGYQPSSSQQFLVSAETSGGTHYLQFAHALGGSTGSHVQLAACAAGDVINLDGIQFTLD